MVAPVSVLSLSDSDKQQLLEWASAFGTPQQVVLRCRIVLAAASGQAENSIAKQWVTNRHTVRLWRSRFGQQGLQSLWEIAPGRGRKPTYGPEKIQEIIATTLQSKPKGRTQWSCRSLAERIGVSKSTVSNIWRSHNLKPHRGKTFTLSRDPHVLQKLTDVVGLYLKFLRCLDEEFPGPVPLHLVMDNYGTHRKEEVRAWLKKHPRFRLHFVPTSSSWLNLVERWFGELSRQCIRRGAFFSVADLEKAIREFLDAWNEHPKPLVWTATVESIIEKLSRCRQTLEKIQPGCTLPRRRKKKQ